MSVLRTGPDELHGYRWTVDFTGNGGNLPLLLANGTALLGTFATVTVTETVAGTIPMG